LGLELNIEYEDYQQEEIETKLNAARNNLLSVQKNAIEHRQKHLGDLAERYASENNLSKQKAVQELLMHESVRHTFAVLKEKLKPHQQGQITKVWVAMDENGNYTKDHQKKIVLSDREKVHESLLSRNKRHLTQARNTPFARGRLSKAMKWDGTGDIGRDLLSGEILNKERFSSTIQLYFESLTVSRISPKLNIIKPTLTQEEYRSFWKKRGRIL